MGSRGSRASTAAKPVNNFADAGMDEKISAVAGAQVRRDKFVFFATRRRGQRKRALSDFGNPRKAGIIAIALDSGDNLIGVAANRRQTT